MRCPGLTIPIEIIKAYHDIFVGETPWSRQKDQVAAPELLEVTAVVVPILIGVMDTDQDRCAWPPLPLTSP